MSNTIVFGLTATTVARFAVIVFNKTALRRQHVRLAGAAFSDVAWVKEVKASAIVFFGNKLTTALSL